MSEHTKAHAVLDAPCNTRADMLLRLAALGVLEGVGAETRIRTSIQWPGRPASEDEVAQTLADWEVWG